MSQRSWVGLLAGVAGLAITGFFAAGCNSSVGNSGDMVGGPCAVNSECFIDSYCLTGTDWPAGYCAASCDTNDDCPGGSVCVEAEGGVCLVDCITDGGCRTSLGYVCAEFEARGAGGNVTGCALPTM